MTLNKNGTERYANGKEAALAVLKNDDIQALVVGAGFAGAVMARELAERGGRRVLIIDQREQVGGNAYDQFNEAGVLVHVYGPHIFHTNDERAWNYLSRFTTWRAYEHEVLANINGILTPVPFNFNSIEQHFEPQKAAELIETLQATYGSNTKVPIRELRATENPLLASLADFVYENVFLRYTLKQWGLTPEQLDPGVTARVPVYTGRDNRYFTDTYQGMPGKGYTALFDALLDHENITVVLGVNAKELLRFDTGSNPAAYAQVDNYLPYKTVSINNVCFNGPLIFTGALDELASRRYGMLPYRTLKFDFKTLEQEHFQPVGTVNYTTSEEYTRITEFSWLTGQQLECTTTAEEYSLPFTGKPEQTPFYPIESDENTLLHKRYRAIYGSLAQFITVGRLAEYRYYNMDQIVTRALELADQLIDNGQG